MVVLKPLADALARRRPRPRGHPRQRDQPGRPHQRPHRAQRRCRRRRWCAGPCDARACAPRQIAYVEAHGTGTPLGDPIELNALGARWAPAGRPARRCALGSVKTNIGHLEAAAGVAGLIKVALALEHREIPPSLHFERRTRTSRSTRCPSRSSGRWGPGPRTRRRRLAGVSSFGFGGTNVHAVLQEPPGAGADHAGNDRAWPWVLPLSAPSPEGLDALAERWRRRLAGARPAETDRLVSAAGRRRQHRHRLAVAGSTISDLAAALAARSPAGAAASAPPDPGASPRVGLVFTGQAAGWDGTAAALLGTSPLFASAVRRCDEAAAAAGGAPGSLVDRLRRGGADPRDTATIQPLQVAVQLALAELLRSWGVQPVAVAGHSLGELPAAVIAGVLDPDDAMALAVRRGLLMADARGAMLGVDLTAAEAEARAGASAGTVSVAALNGPREAVLSGDPDALAAIETQLLVEGHRTRWLPTDHAFHSRRVEGAAAALVDGLALDHDDPAVAWYSTVLGRPVGAGEVTPAYWARNVRDTVRFHDAVAALLADGIDVVVEVGPAPALTGSVRRIASALGAPVPATVAAWRGDDAPASLARAVAMLYGEGVPVRWSRLHPTGVPMISLPRHPWDHRRYWLDRVDPAPAPTLTGGSPPTGGVDADGALLGRPTGAGADGGGPRSWRTTVTAGSPPELGDHRVGEVALLPATATIETALAAATGDGPTQLRDVRWEAPVPLDGTGVELETTLVPVPDHPSAAEGTIAFRRAGSTEDWRVHTRFVLDTAPPPEPEPGPGAGPDAPTVIPGDELYEALARRGLHYGPAFRLVAHVGVHAGRAHGHLVAPGDRSGALVLSRTVDAALHLLAALPATSAAGDERLRVPVAAERVTVRRDPRTSVTAAAGPDPDTAGTYAVELRDAAGRLTLSLRGVALGTVVAPAGAGGRASGEPDCWALTWRPAPSTGTTASGPASTRWLVLGGAPDLAARLTRALTDRGADVVTRPAGGPPGDALAAATSDGRVPLAGIVRLPVADPDGPGGDAGRRARDVTTGVLALVRSVATLPQSTVPAVVVVTDRAHRLDGDPAGGGDPAEATLSALLRSVQVENPLQRYRAIDVPLAGADDATIAALADEVLEPGPEREVALRDGRRLVARLQPAAPACPRHRHLTLDPDGTYVVSGGTGALGTAVAERLAQRGAGRLALIARRADSDAADSARRRLEGAGATVDVIAGDVADRATLARHPRPATGAGAAAGCRARRRRARRPLVPRRRRRQRGRRVRRQGGRRLAPPRADRRRPPRPVRALRQRRGDPRLARPERVRRRQPVPRRPRRRARPCRPARHRHRLGTVGRRRRHGRRHRRERVRPAPAHGGHQHRPLRRPRPARTARAGRPAPHDGARLRPAQAPAVLPGRGRPPLRGRGRRGAGPAQERGRADPHPSRHDGPAHAGGQHRRAADPRHLAAGAGHRADRDPRQLLRARRRLGVRQPDPPGGEPRPRGRGPRRCRLRRPDRGQPGQARRGLDDPPRRGPLRRAGARAGHTRDRRPRSPDAGPPDPGGAP